MDGAEIDTTGAVALDEGEIQTQPRDFEAEARKHGWTAKEEFKGDSSRWVDAETFVKRADEVMPFLKKQNAALKGEIDDLKRTMKQSSEFYSKTEERAYNRALADLQAKHDAAVEEGDVKASRAVLKEMDDLKADRVPAEVKGGNAAPDPTQARKELDAWVADNDWYVLDDAKRRYADLQASVMGPAGEFEGGQKAWLDELGSRVEKRFADDGGTKKPSPVNGGGNRQSPSGGAKTFNDLPQQARAICDKWHKNGVFGDPGKVTLEQARARYVKDYDFGA